MNKIKTGSIFSYGKEPFQVVTFAHTHKGRGGATVRVKIKNLISGNVLDRAFKSGDKLEEASISRTRAQFLFADATSCNFMDNESYEQFAISKEHMQDQLAFLKEGDNVEVLLFEQKPITVQLKKKIELSVIETEPGTRGDTAQGSVMKNATLETGHTLQVPLFVKTGDCIRINTETGEYVERVT